MELIHAAGVLFEKSNYRLPSVIDIVEQAELAKGTFYLYFETKEELFLEMLELGFKQWLLSLGASITSETLEDPQLLARAALRPVLHDRCFLQLASMTQSILEQNLRAERATSFKLRLGLGMETLALELNAKLNVSPQDMIELMMDCYAAIIGTWQNTQVTQSIAVIQHKIPYPFLFQKFEDRVERLVTQIIMGRSAYALASR